MKNLEVIAMEKKKNKKVQENEELIQEYIEQVEEDDGEHFYSEFSHNDYADGGCCC